MSRFVLLATVMLTVVTLTACNPTPPTASAPSVFLKEVPPDLPKEVPPEERGRMGLVSTELTTEQAIKARVGGGVLIEAVYPDSPAEKAGLVTGDVITKLNKQDVPCCGVFQARLQGKSRAGEQVSLTVAGTAGVREVKLTLVREPASWLGWERTRFEKGDPWAKRMMALRHVIGNGVRPNSAFAVSTLTPLADAGDREAGLLLGELLINGQGEVKNPTAGFARLLSAAKKGDPTAQAMIAGCYRTGLGTSKQPEQAAHWARLSAEAGHPVGLSEAAMVEMGAEPNRPRDPRRALDLARRAASLHDPNAYWLIGTIYLEGFGVEKHLPTARAWLEKVAGVTDWAEVHNSLGLLEWKEGDFAAARMRFQKSVEKGDALGYELMGVALEEGKGGDRNPQAALQHYEEAVKRGSESAGKRADRLRQALRTSR